MGLIGRYIDALPTAARDRLIQAQDWCVAGVLGPRGQRCLIGHAEDWRPLASEPAWWRRWTESQPAAPGAGGARRETELETACRPELFAFRCAYPADLEAYRRRVLRWGLASESRIGSRFDRLCARRGRARAVRAVKARAARAFRPDLAARGAYPAAAPVAGAV